jgi:catecholate siderophore receptor
MFWSYMMRMVGSSILAIALGQLIIVSAHAEEVSADSNEPIVVNGTASDYTVASTNSATKTDTPLIDVPQSINIVTKEQIEDQALHSIGDVLRYVPGTTVGQGEGNRDQIVLRGQNTTADFFIDGVRDDVQYFRGLYNVDRVEILKGASALAFGRGGGGGVVNRVQKMPEFGSEFIAGRTSVSSFGAHDVAADLNAPLSNIIAVRLNANYESLDNQRDYYGGERFAWNPSATAKLGEDWTLGASYEYVNDDRVADRGVPSLNGTPVTGYRDQFFGVPGINSSTLEAHIAKLRLDGALTETLKLSGSLLYGNYDKAYANVYANSALDPLTNVVTLAAYNSGTTRENIIGQANLVWDVATGSVAHKILAGVEFSDQRTLSHRFNGVLSSAAFDLDNPVFPTLTFPILANNNRSKVDVFSAYMQDQISLGTHFDIIAGVRYDRFRIKGTEFVSLAAATQRAFGRIDEKVSPRIGLIYKPQENVSVYASYSQSFLPRSGDQFSTLSLINADLAPEKFTNTEIGVKWNLLSGLSMTLAAYQLDRTNATTPDPVNPATATIVIGKTRTKGIEFGLSGQITPDWQVSGGYSYQDAALQENRDVRLSQTPKHQFSLWNRYNLSKDLGVGVGVIHQSSMFAAIRTLPTVTRVPGFTRVDAAVFYDLSDKVQLQANVENLFDTTYFPDAHSNNNISTGAPINGRIGIKVRF